MRYFTVERREIVGTIVSGEGDSEGEYLVLPQDEESGASREIDYVVYELDENGVMLEVRYGLTLDEIKKEYSADKGWQNNSW